MQIYNCHTHIFNLENVPEKFLPFILRPVGNLIGNSVTAKALIGVAKIFGKHETALLIKKYNAFINIGKLNGQLAIFKHQQGFYPEGTKFIVLTMDMEYMEAGKVWQSYEEQLIELANIKKDPKFSDVIYPFVFAHPERPNVYDVVQKGIEQYNFAGIKIYPPLGYYPFDKRLYKIWEYAEKNQIPVMAHCSRGGVFYKGKITDEMCIHPETKEKIDKRKNKYFTDCYTDPDNYEYLLKDFPNLKICLAHFGGADEWEDYLTTSWTDKNKKKSNWYVKIKDLISHPKYPNVYTDISYTLSDKKYFNLLKVTLQDERLRKKVLYGSDFYMLEQEITEREFSINLRAFLDDKDYGQIAEINPKTYLTKN